VEIVRDLIAHGASINAIDKIRHSALWYAVARYDGEAEVVDALLQGGADVDEGNGSLLQIAALQRDARVLEVLLKHGADPNAHEPGGMTALMTASSASYGNIDQVKVLLAHGAAVDVQHPDGTAWVLARRAGNMEILHLLEGAGATRYSRWPPSQNSGANKPLEPTPKDGAAQRRR
jgi:ankyrin repeat protein